MACLIQDALALLELAPSNACWDFVSSVEGDECACSYIPSPWLLLPAYVFSLWVNALAHQFKIEMTPCCMASWYISPILDNNNHRSRVAVLTSMCLAWGMMQLIKHIMQSSEGWCTLHKLLSLGSQSHIKFGGFVLSRTMQTRSLTSTICVVAGLQWPRSPHSSKAVLLSVWLSYATLLMYMLPHWSNQRWLYLEAAE